VITHWRRAISVALVAALCGCTSPESERTRGESRGADVGNHPAGPVEIHAGARIYYGTPILDSGIHGPSRTSGDTSARAR
jgi:hypothetical protein